MRCNAQGHLVIGGADCTELAATYATPLYVVDSDLIEANYHSFYEHFTAQGITPKIFCSYKTNSTPGIIQVLHGCGAGAEVISPFELDLAFKLGVTPSDIIYNGPNKSIESLKEAVVRKIALINVNSIKEIGELHSIGMALNTRIPVGVRIGTSVGWSGQFGFKVSSGDALEAFRKIQETGNLEPAAIHFHLGTGLKNLSTYAKAIAEAVAFIRLLKEKLGITITILDIGGGYGIPSVRSLNSGESTLYSDYNVPLSAPDVTHHYTIPTIAKVVADTLKQECGRNGIAIPKIYIEPGRAMTCNTQILLGAIGDFKTAEDGNPIAMCDAGLNLALPTTWEYHEMFAANKMNQAAEKYYRIVGPTCSPSDLLTRSKKLPALAAGDLIAVMDAGAYFASFAYSFSFPRAATVLVEKGHSRIIRRRETFDDMLACDMLLQKTRTEKIGLKEALIYNTMLLILTIQDWCFTVGHETFSLLQSFLQCA
ncbi:MAG: hypothetical protein JW795_20060 [Chitinivibrionales bacterium]|nr:hypothetical protein [Chitinivibrionales bacterium]